MSTSSDSGSPYPAAAGVACHDEAAADPLPRAIVRGLLLLRRPAAQLTRKPKTRTWR